jgi:hypothetical protein
MTSSIPKFEKTYQTDPSREIAVEIECGRIELTDQELLQRIRLNMGLEKETLVYRPLALTPEVLDESTALGKKYKKALEICKDTNFIKVKDAKSKSKSPKRKAKKNHPKANSTTMARMEKKL